MKKILLLFSAIIFSIPLLSQQVIEWQKTYGGTANDGAKAIARTSDGGFIMAGHSFSTDGDVTNHHGSGNDDFWVVKINAAGTIQWQKCLGGTHDDAANDIQQTADGGYIVAGYAYSTNGDVSGQNGSNSCPDFWIVKLSSSGTLQWQKCIGGTWCDFAYSIRQTSDGGYVVIGSGNSVDGDITCYHTGYGDYIFKLDSNGNIQWIQCLDTYDDHGCTSVRLTNDGGYVVGGQEQGSLWLRKLDSNGSTVWNRAYGGAGSELASSISLTSDGGYIAAGYTNSNDGNVSGNHGGYDFWVVKMNSTGLMQWQKCLGGSSNDYATSIFQTPDGGFVVGGYTQSNDGNVSGNHGGTDYWLTKLDMYGNLLWSYCMGGSGNDYGYSLCMSPDGKFIVAGTTASADGNVTVSQGAEDVWAVKFKIIYNAITGTVFSDINNNLVHEVNELTIANLKITESSTGGFTYSSADGHYSIPVRSTGSYTVSPSPITNYNLSPSQHTASFSSMLQIDSLNDFAFYAPVTFNDLTVSITPPPAFRAGRNSTYTIRYKNSGSSVIAPTIIFFKDNFLSYAFSSVAPVATSADSIVWSLPSLFPLEQKTISITLTVAAGTAVGTYVHCYARIDPLPGDINLTNNYGGWETPLAVTASLDPNEIRVGRSKIFTNELASPPYLDYVINFQNTGNDTAFTVLLENQLPLTLDASSMELVNGSHPVDVQYDPITRNLEFIFSNILLPDSTIDEEASHGFVHYKIKPVSTLISGDTIRNVASIYFDFNEAVITNTAKTAVRHPSTAITTNNNNFCSGGQATLTIDSALQTLTRVWNWYTGTCAGTLIGTGNTITVSPVTTTTYYVRDTSGSIPLNNCFSRSVTIQTAPAATITAGGPTSFCQGNSVTLTASAATSYQWSTGAMVQSITVASSGNYLVTVTNSAGCTASASISVTVNSLPAASITPGGPTTFCQGNMVTLTASPAAAYLWSTGSTGQSINVSASGNYSVQVTNANGCSATSPATAVTVNPSPVASISPSGPTTFCQGNSVTLTSSAANNYLWSNSSTAQSINVTSSGNYAVTVTGVNGCTASASVMVAVNPLPVATIIPSGPTTFCQGNSVTLTSNASNSYLWSNSSTTQSINVTSPGSYVVTVTDANNCTASSSAVLVTVNPLPTASITPSGPTAFCQGNSVTLTSSAASSYLWSNTSSSQSINVTASGNYSVTITAANGCTASSSAVTVTVNPLPTASVTPSGPTTFCQGNSVTLTASVASSYLWSNSSSTQSINVTASGNYAVTVTAANGCTASSSAVTVTVNPLPTASITPGGPTTFCQGNSVTLTSSAASSYLWSNSSTTQNINVTSSGNYVVTVTDGNNCTASSSAVSVTVNPLPTASITTSGPTTFCEGDSVILTAIAANTYLWSNSAATQSINVISSGNYAVTVTDVNTCTASTSLSVTVNPNPPAPAITQAGDSLTSDAATTYQWYFNSVLIPGATSQSYHPTQNGNYSVVIWDANNCMASSTDYPFVLTGAGDLTNEKEISIYPNPAKNELYVISYTLLKKAEITICNALGEEVDKSEIRPEASGSKSGIINVSSLPRGIYFIKVKLEEKIVLRKIVLM